jgi:hypothetical protein
MRFWILCCALLPVAAPALAASPPGSRDPTPAPAHGRPYFMPEKRRAAILERIERADWARQRYRALRREVSQAHKHLGTPKFTRRDGWQRDGYHAALLYALEGEKAHLEVAEAWLRHAYGPEARDTRRRRRRLEDDAYWKGHEKGVDWYRLDIEAYVAYDWIHDGLSADARRLIAKGLRTQTRYRMACMDAWGSTPNLNFKPIFMVAFAGMALRDDDILRWGWRRQRRQGNFASMKNRLLRDQGLWHEASIYPVGHSNFWAIATMAFYRGLYEQTNRFAHRTPGGASAQGMTDYFLATAFAREGSAPGERRHRLITFGDGATRAPVGGGTSDLFIGGPAPSGNRRMAHMRAGLAMAYAASGKERYARFLSLYRSYEPNLWDRPPLPDDAGYPRAGSHVWPDFGLAVLRADASPKYYTSDDGLAAWQMMDRGYGHDHPDKLHLGLFGAGRPMYPDFMIRQYEARQMGWGYSSASHNTMLVDERDTPGGGRTSARSTGPIRDALITQGRAGEPAPNPARHTFHPEVKFLATHTKSLYPGVGQTRALFLADGYLLDLFHAESRVPHTYDYVLHSLGAPRDLRPGSLGPRDALSDKYWAMEEPKGGAVDGPWSLVFAFAPEPPEKAPHGFGRAWFEHEARLRLTMAEAPDTRIAVGTWGGEKYRQRYKRVYGVSEQRAKRRLGEARLGMVVARRADRRRTTFAAAHAPFEAGEAPVVRDVKSLAQTPGARVVRVDGKGFRDYAAVAWGGPGDAEQRRRVLETNAGDVFAFSGHAWLRVTDEGETVARGGWEGLRLGESVERLRGNGERRAVKEEAGRLVMGEAPQRAPSRATPAPPSPFPVKPAQDELRLRNGRSHPVRFTIENTLDESIRGTLVLGSEQGLIGEEAGFGPIAPGAQERIEVTARVEESAPRGDRKAAYRVAYCRASETEPTETAWQALPTIIERAVRPEHADGMWRWRYEDVRISSRLESNGTVGFLADPQGAVRRAGSPLFTVHAEGEKDPLTEGRPVPGVSIWPKPGARVSARGMQLRLDFRADRIGPIRWVRRYTGREKYAVRVPGGWRSPEGKPRWDRVLVVDGQGGEPVAGESGTEKRVAAAALAFPGSPWRLAFAFTPARRVRFEGTGLRFDLPRPPREGPTPSWSVGFCRPGELAAWRTR